MKPLFALTLIACLTTSARPVAAQDRTGPSSPGTWRAVQQLRPGLEVVVTAKGSAPGTRYFALADATRLTVLNLTDPALPREATRMLMNIGLRHPEYFADALKTGQFLDRNVRVGPDGVFVADRKVADLGQIVETVAQADVAEVSSRQRGRGFWGHLGPLGGYFVGAMAGGFVGGFACKAVGGGSCDGPYMVGVGVGGVAGAIHGFVAARRETDIVVYRAP